MGLRGKLRRLEKQAEGFCRTLTLPDGQQIRYTDEEVMAALSAAIHQQEHYLLPYIRQLGPSKGVPSMIGLVGALVESHDRNQQVKG
jgi:hypothetical protein